MKKSVDLILISSLFKLDLTKHQSINEYKYLNAIFIKEYSRDSNPEEVSIIFLTYKKVLV